MKTLLTIAGVVAAGAIAYFAFFRKKSPIQPAGVSQDPGSTANALTNALLGSTQRFFTRTPPLYGGSSGPGSGPGSPFNANAIAAANTNNAAIAAGIGAGGTVAAAGLTAGISALGKALDSSGASQTAGQAADASNVFTGSGGAIDPNMSSPSDLNSIIDNANATNDYGGVSDPLAGFDTASSYPSPTAVDTTIPNYGLDTTSPSSFTGVPVTDAGADTSIAV